MMENNLKKMDTCICTTNHFVIHLRLTQCWKSTTLWYQIRIKLKIRIEEIKKPHVTLSHGGRGCVFPAQIWVLPGLVILEYRAFFLLPGQRALRTATRLWEAPRERPCQWCLDSPTGAPPEPHLRAASLPSPWVGPLRPLVQPSIGWTQTQPLWNWN